MMSPELHAEDLLDREARGALTAEERARLESHLVACSVCRFERQVRGDFRDEFRSPAGRRAPRARLAKGATRLARRGVAATGAAGRAPARVDGRGAALGRRCRRRVGPRQAGGPGRSDRLGEGAGPDRSFCASQTRAATARRHGESDAEASAVPDPEPSPDVAAAASASPAALGNVTEPSTRGVRRGDAPGAIRTASSSAATAAAPSPSALFTGAAPRGSAAVTTKPCDHRRFDSALPELDQALTARAISGNCSSIGATRVARCPFSTPTSRAASRRCARKCCSVARSRSASCRRGSRRPRRGERCFGLTRAPFTQSAPGSACRPWKPSERRAAQRARWCSPRRACCSVAAGARSPTSSCRRVLMRVSRWRCASRGRRSTCKRSKPRSES